MATKALGQDDKDAAGQEEMDARRAAEEQAGQLSDADRETLQARRAGWTPDDQLDELPDLELLDEARARGLTFTHAVTRDEVIAAARKVTADLDRPSPALGDRTKPELLAEAVARGVEVPKGAKKADIVEALSDQTDQQEG